MHNVLLKVAFRTVSVTEGRTVKLFEHSSDWHVRGGLGER
jgi:hypothetical protein